MWMFLSAVQLANAKSLTMAVEFGIETKPRALGGIWHPAFTATGQISSSIAAALSVAGLRVVGGILGIVKAKG